MSFFRKQSNFLGALFLGAFLVPGYSYLHNYPTFSLSQFSIIVLTFTIIHLFIITVFSFIFRNDTKVLSLTYVTYILFWFSHPIACYFAKKLRFLVIFSNFRWPLLIIAVLSTLIACFYAVQKFSKFLAKINKVTDVFSFLLCCLIIFQILFKIYYFKDNSNFNQSSIKVNSQNNKKLPNIYHILLDAHPNQKAIEMIGGNLTPFYQKLENLGFLTFPKSTSNYPSTVFSVSSMLNLQYHQGDETLLTTQVLLAKIKNNMVFKKLSNEYKVHIFLSTDLLEPLYSSHLIENTADKGSVFTLFYTLFCHTSIKHTFENYFSEKFANSCRKSIKATLQQSINGKIKYASSNHLFYTHILCPHEPCVFSNHPTNRTFNGFLISNDSTYINSKETLNDLCENVYGIDQLALSAIQKIVKQYENEEIKPIIILHSDHSILYTAISVKSPLITVDTIYGNLLALYIPEEWKEDAKDLKFINLYRFILNHLLNERYEYLEQRQMYKGKDFVN